MKYDVSLQTIAWLNGRRNDKTLEISPTFQRRPVWLEAERSALMVTVLENLPFPEIYIHHATSAEDGSERHIVVDGQQRVTSLLMFIDGSVRLPEDAKWQGKGFKDLEEEVKQAFWQYRVVVRGLSQTNDAEIRELFTKLNTNNIALNDQELRNARHQGRFKQLAERMADNPLFHNIGLFTPRDIRRMLDVEYASELLLLTMEGVTNKKDMLDDAYAAYDEDLPGEPELENAFVTTMNLVRTIVTNDSRGQVKRKSNFYSLYGAALEYMRRSGRTAFRKPDTIAAAVSDLLNSAHEGAAGDKPPFYADYFEAVSRAASDKGRRAQRQDILLKVIEDADGAA